MKSFKITLIVLMSLIILLAISFSGWGIGQESYKHLFDIEKKHEMIKFFGWILGGTIAVFALILANQRMANQDKQIVNQDKQLDETIFNNAVSHLESENPSNILAGFHSLLNLAKRNKDYRKKIFNICSHFLSELAKKEKKIFEGDSERMILLGFYVSDLYKALWSELFSKELYEIQEGIRLKFIDLSGVDLDWNYINNTSLQSVEMKPSGVISNINIKNSELGLRDVKDFWLSGGSVKNYSSITLDLENKRGGFEQMIFRSSSWNRFDIGAKSQKGEDFRVRTSDVRDSNLFIDYKNVEIYSSDLRKTNINFLDVKDKDRELNLKIHNNVIEGDNFLLKDFPDLIKENFIELSDGFYKDNKKVAKSELKDLEKILGYELKVKK